MMCCVHIWEQHVPPFLHDDAAGLACVSVLVYGHEALALHDVVACQQLVLRSRGTQWYSFAPMQPSCCMVLTHANSNRALTLVTPLDVLSEHLNLFPQGRP